jgi:hypothetical protein
VRPCRHHTRSGIDNSANLNHPLGNPIRINADRLIYLIEELSLIEGRRIPDSVFALQLQIHSVRQTIVTKLDKPTSPVR